jgi:hypothetical protein
MSVTRHSSSLYNTTSPMSYLQLGNILNLQFYKYINPGIHTFTLRMGCWIRCQQNACGCKPNSICNKAFDWSTHEDFLHGLYR